MPPQGDFLLDQSTGFDLTVPEPVPEFDFDASQIRRQGTRQAPVPQGPRRPRAHPSVALAWPTRPVLPSFSDQEGVWISYPADDELMQHGIDHDQTAFIEKPYTPVSLARKVRAVLDA